MYGHTLLLDADWDIQSDGAGGISLQSHTHRGDSGGTTGKPQ